MKRRLFVPIVFVVVFIMLVSTACTSSGKKETAAPTDLPQVAPLSAVTSDEFLVTRLEDVKKAVVQIESQGTFIDPEFGLQVNAAGRGTGFIIDSSGIAVTNNHVVTGAALIDSVHAASQGAGQTRPVTSGRLFVISRRSSASRHSPR